MVRLILGWLGLLPIMIANGVARQSLYGSSMSELLAHQVSTITGVILLLAYTWLLLPRLGIDSQRRAWMAGGLWLGLTVVFEFGFGHFVAGHSWSRLFQDYNLLEGRVWSLFLVVVFVAPWLVLRVRR
jgi:hypothetical protein